MRYPSPPNDVEIDQTHTPIGGAAPVENILQAVRTALKSRVIRMTITYGIVMIAIISVGTTALLINLRGRAIADKEVELQSVALVLAEQIDRSFQATDLIQRSLIDRIMALQIATTDETNRKLSGHDFHLKLKDSIGGLPHIAAVSIINAEGILINSSRDWPTRPINVVDRNYFRALATNPKLPSFVSEPVHSRSTGRWTINIARRIAGPHDQFAGIVLVAMNLSYFENLFEKVALRNDGNISLIRRDGVLLARYPHLEASIGKSLAANPLFTTLIANANTGAARLTSRIDGQDRLIAAHDLPNYPIVVAVGTTISAALANWRNGAQYMAGGAALMILVVSGVILLSQRHLWKRLQAKNVQLDTALNNMSQGLAMFNSAGRFIVCNKRYSEIYNLPSDFAKPGCTIRDLLEYRGAAGTFSENPDQYIDDLYAKIAQKNTTSTMTTLSDGRTIAVVNQPMRGGGWVATHEDVTEAKQREASFTLLFKNNPVPMWVYDIESLCFLAVNEAAVALYGYRHDEFSSMAVSHLRPIEDRVSFANFLRALPDEQFIENIGQHWKADGTVVDVAVFSRSLTYEGHRARLAAIHDITKAKHVERELKRTKNFLDAIIENVPVPIIVKDVAALKADARDSKFTLFNRAYEELTGDPRTQLIGKKAHEIFPRTRADLVVRSDNDALRSDQAVTTTEHIIPTSHKGDRLVTAKKTIIRDDNGEPQYILSVVDDVTERRRTEQHIAHMAHHDPLTDLPNRAAFNEYFSATIENSEKSGERFAILNIDLDRFKEANDTYGHTIGDELLREVAHRLQRAAEGTFIARVGGDEFTAIMRNDAQPVAATLLAEQLLAAFEADFEIDGHLLQMRVSIGGAIYPTDGTDAKALMVNADAALYRAKAELRGSVVFFEPEFGVQLRDRRNLQNDLQSALEHNEFLLHYQPQVRMTGETIGFEALLRWRSPKRGMVYPGSFIPLAEESKYIIPIGEWVLREACREAASWSRPLKVGLNVSPVQFHHGDLPNLVHSILLETGLAPARLEIEITEGVLINDFSRAVAILRRLKSLGVTIALDDFGTGYSSLSYLHSFPFDKIKIDRSFISDLDCNRHSMAIVGAVIELGHSLSIPIIAEGVETELQHALLAKEGCDEMQGYLFGKPLPISDYVEHIGRKLKALAV